MDDQTTTPISSVEKVDALLEHQLTQMAGDPVARSGMLMARQLFSLPDDPEVLDAQLAQWAQLCCALRSDGTPELHVAHADGTPLALPEE